MMYGKCIMSKVQKFSWYDEYVVINKGSVGNDMVIWYKLLCIMKGSKVYIYKAQDSLSKYSTCY